MNKHISIAEFNEAAESPAPGYDTITVGDTVRLWIWNPATVQWRQLAEGLLTSANTSFLTVEGDVFWLGAGMRLTKAQTRE